MAKQILSTIKNVGEFRKALQNINYNNIQAYVSQNMPENHKMFLAKIFEDTTTVKWYIDDEINQFKSLSKATEEEEIEVYNLLYQQNEIARKKLLENKELAIFTDKIISIPSQDCIFFTKKSDGNFLISLTKWGYIPTSQRRNDNVISSLIKKRQPKKHTIVNLAYTTGEPISQANFYIEKGGIRELKTDADGNCNLLYLPTGTTIKASLDVNLVKDIQEFTVVDEQTQYFLNFPFYTEASIKVIDQFNDICIGTPIFINGQVHNTNSEGIVKLDFLELKGDDKLTVSQDQKENTENIFLLHKEASTNNFTYQLNQDYECSLRIQVNYKDGTPAVNYAVQVGANENQKFDTDQQGLIQIANQNIGSQVLVTDWSNPENTISVELQKGINDTQLIVNRPIEEKVRIALIDHEKNPIKGASIKVVTHSNIENVQETDLDGFVYYPKKIFKDNSTIKCVIKANNVNGSDKEKEYVKKIKHQDEISEYTLQLKKKNWKWLWLLLLLLPIPLFLNFEKTISTHTVLKDGTSLTPTEVTATFTSRYLYKDGNFFVEESYVKTQHSNENGKAVFKDIGFSGYSYIFYMFSKINFKAKGECCVQKDNLDASLHFFKSGEQFDIVMQQNLIDVSVKVVDAELDSPIIDAKVTFEFENEGSVRKSSRTDSKGEIVVPSVPKCGIIDSLMAEKYGYKNEGKQKLNVERIIGDIPNVVLYLTPIKKQITFFVKNKFTNEPLPKAKVSIKLQDPRSSKSSETTTKTDLDGRGVGFYDDVFLLSTLQLFAECKYFKSNKLKGKYKIEEFIKLPDSLRTIYLEPEPYTVNFRNIDSLTLSPLAGIKNIIEVNGQDGRSYRDEQISNRNGVFNVKARKGDNVKIVSQGGEYFYDQNNQFDFDNEKDIKLKAKEVELSFRAIESYNNELLDNCNLKIIVNGQIDNQISNSGNGEFSIKVRAIDKVSIESYKTGYLPNKYQIEDKIALGLFKASQSKRDIIMQIEPCVSTSVNYKDSDKVSIKQYDMKKLNGEFVFEYNTDSAADHIEIYDGKINEMSRSNLIFSVHEATGNGSKNNKKVKIKFSKRIITVKVFGTGTAWDYWVNCPE